MEIRRYIDIVKENQQGFVSADGDELPPVLYHGTIYDTWENFISKVGLDPSKTDPRGEDEEGYDDIYYNKGFVFLAWDIEQAREWAPGGYYNSTFDGAGAILSVQLDENLAKNIITSLGEFIRCPVVIPPSKLKLVEITNK